MNGDRFWIAWQMDYTDYIIVWKFINMEFFELVKLRARIW